VLLIVLGVLSRLFILSLLRRISASPSRDVTPSMLPGTPWFTVDSDRQALKIIVVATYGSVLLGMLLVLIGLLV
jgi:hypothetical protein